MTDSTITKGKLFVEDLAIANGGTGSEETGTRLTSAGGVVTLTKLDLSHIPYRNYASTPEDLLDGGQDVDILPKDIDAGGDVNIDGTLTVGGANTLSDLGAGYVKSSAAGLLSSGVIAAADLPAAIDVEKLGSGDITNTVFQYLEGVTSKIQDQLNAITAGSISLPSAILQNRQASTVDGGTATTGSWLIVPLNVEYEDADSIVDSTALPAFSLDAGTYQIQAMCPFYNTAISQIRLYNVTDGAVQANVGASDIIGSVTFCSSAGGALSIPCSFLFGTFTLAGTKQLRLEYRVSVTRATGLGYPATWGENIYAQAIITQIA